MDNASIARVTPNLEICCFSFPALLRETYGQASWAMEYDGCIPLGTLSPDGYWCKRKASCFNYPSVIMESIRLCDLAGRNRRIFQGMKESDIRLVQVVFDTVRLRMQAWPRVRHKLPTCMKVSCAFGNSL